MSEKQKRNRSGHMATMAAFKCSACGYSVSMYIKWAKEIRKCVCLNPSCNPRFQIMTRQGLLTVDQLTPEENATYCHMTNEGGSDPSYALAVIQSQRNHLTKG